LVNGAVLKDTVSCGIDDKNPCSTLDYAIYGVLDKNAVIPLIYVVGFTSLKQNTDITGINFFYSVFICLFFCK
jgi:hypothetical protein